MIARRIHQPIYQTLALYMVGKVHMLAERYEPIPDLCRQGLDIAQSIDHDLGVGYFLDQMGSASCALGRHDESILALTRAIGIFDALQAEHPRALCLFTLGRAHRALNNQAQASECFEEALTEFIRLGMASYAEQSRAVLQEIAAHRSAADNT